MIIKILINKNNNNNNNKNEFFLGCVDNKNTLRLFESKNDYKQKYVGNKMGNKIVFGGNSLITVEGYELNLFNINNLQRINRLKSNYHKNIINNIALQSDDSKGNFVTTDINNLLHFWEFNESVTNAKCCAIINNAHNKNDKNIYSNLKLRHNINNIPKITTTKTTKWK